MDTEIKMQEVAGMETGQPAMLPQFNLIRGWAHDRNLVKGSDSFRQSVKLGEEMGELFAGVARGNRAQIRDSIGDCAVVLTILAEQYGLTIEECVLWAWNEIRDRKGRMIDGVFVKEADLPQPAPAKAEEPKAPDLFSDGST